MGAATVCRTLWSKVCSYFRPQSKMAAFPVRQCMGWRSLTSCWMCCLRSPQSHTRYRSSIGRGCKMWQFISYSGGDMHSTPDHWTQSAFSDVMGSLSSEDVLPTLWSTWVFPMLPVMPWSSLLVLTDQHDATDVSIWCSGRGSRSLTL